METMKLEKEPDWKSPGADVWLAWLHVDGKAVSYVRLMEEKGYKGYVCVCDIETREGYRNKGYAKKLLELASS